MQLAAQQVHEVVVVVVGALRTDGQVHLQQNAGLRIFMEHLSFSFTTFRRQDGEEAYRYHYQYHNNYRLEPLPLQFLQNKTWGEESREELRTSENSVTLTNAHSDHDQYF